MSRLIIASDIWEIKAGWQDGWNVEAGITRSELAEGCLPDRKSGPLREQKQRRLTWLWLKATDTAARSSTLETNFAAAALQLIASKR